MSMLTMILHAVARTLLNTTVSAGTQLLELHTEKSLHAVQTAGERTKSGSDVKGFGLEEELVLPEEKKTYERPKISEGRNVLLWGLRQDDL